MPGSVNTWSYELSLAGGLDELVLVPAEVPVGWVSLRALSEDAFPQERRVTVGVQFGRKQLQWWTTPVHFADIRQENCDPHLDGIYVTAAAQAGMRLVANGGAR
jgi:hypothetical protein